jgi:CRISPR/Cas system-associated endonuclease/helicase Cas3
MRNNRKTVKDDCKEQSPVSYNILSSRSSHSFLSKTISKLDLKALKKRSLLLAKNAKVHRELHKSQVKEVGDIGNMNEVFDLITESEIQRNEDPIGEEKILLAAIIAFQNNIPNTQVIPADTIILSAYVV